MSDTFDPFALARDESADIRETLLRECEAIAAAYRAPLPPGDAGLVAAVQRWRDMRGSTSLGARGFPITVELEGEIVEPIAYEAEKELEDWIESTPAEGLAGVAAKLRYAIEADVDLDYIGAEQLVEIVERESW